MWLQGPGSAISETTELETHIEDVHCAVTPSPTFVNLINIGPQAKHQILAQSVNRFLRYGDGVSRAHVQSYPTNDLYKTHSYWV